MEQYDIVIIGGATTGSYFARKMAERGHRVLVVDRNPEEKIGSKYDIFHICKPDFARFGLPMPAAGEDLAFEFTGSQALSAYGHYPKAGSGTVIGMHMHEYTLRMNRWAREAGAEYRYETPFVDFLYENGKIVGVRVGGAGRPAKEPGRKTGREPDGAAAGTSAGETEIRAGLVADCSGIPSVARTRLPDGYGVENFVIGPTDMFYVILRYVKYLDEKDYLSRLRSWTFYKTWEAPQADPHGAILGIGANFGFDFAEKVYERFTRAVALPRHELRHVERGTTPYRRPPYSFVADGFLVMGDAACLTKPHAGEGVTSSMVQADIAIDVVDALLKKGQTLSRENLWPVNKRYYDGQGKVYAGMLATLVGAVATNEKENEYFFRHDIIFSAKSFDAMAADQSLSYSGAELPVMALKMLWGVITFRVRIRTIRSLLAAMGNGDTITNLYAQYPADADGFEAWRARAEETWARTPGMADITDSE